MSKCTGSHVSSARQTLGGPIIMASNVQQQKQCIKRRHRQTHNSFHQQQRIQLQQRQCQQQHQQQEQQQQQQENQQQLQQQLQHPQRQQQKQQPEQPEHQHEQHGNQQRQPLQQKQGRRRIQHKNSLPESRYVRRGNRLHHLHRPRNLRPSDCLSNLAFDILQLLQFGLVFALFQILFLLTFVNAEGNVGCHFVRTLCLDFSEVCYDDNIFGKCIPTTGVDVEDIEKTPLAEHQSHLLATMLEELQGAGLGWDHPYVQCRIQGALFSLQRETQLPPNLCANLAPSPLDSDPATALAYVRFTPPEDEVEAQLVDYRGLKQQQQLQQLYYPPLKKQGSSSISDILHQLQLQERRSLRHDPLELEHFGKFDVQGSQLETPSVMNAFLDTERQRIEREEALREAELKEEGGKNAQKDRLELYQILAASEPDPQPYQRKQPTSMDQVEEEVAQREKPTPSYVAEEINESSELYFPDNYMALKRGDDKQVQRSFFRELAAEEGLEQASISRDYYSNAQVAPSVKAYRSSPAQKRRPADYDENEVELERQQAIEESLMRNSLTPFEEEAMLTSNAYPRNKPRKFERVFTEGGVVYVPENEIQTDNTGVIKQSLLANMLGFARHERLDVKKPGPLLGPPSQETNNLETDKLAKIDGNKEMLPAHIKGSKEAHKKKKLIQSHSDEDHAPHSVDTEYAHVYVKNPIDSWNDGVRIMNELANVLHMQGYFTYLTVQPHEVSFRVDSNNPEHKTATDVARIIKENRGVKNNILRRLGVTVVYAGVGDKVKAEDDIGVSSSRIELAEAPDVTHIMAYMFAGAGAAAIIVICVTLILIKRHDRKRDKLGGLQSGIAGAESCSKDYQDLCRARMAGKGNAAEPAAGGRITSLSKENDRPPSSRSSTSSWSEEPALTNMDISTGHMVLSYMEDHLRNKGRLQREWEALCRYEAEPSARDAATQPQCANLNRPGAPIPYDHSRVVLNHLANADGLDYVNASTITDHDPRAPVCYVAAQGPTPSTLAHFWQMIWEQGAVVIVALCRLQENGEVACARYWPEEGAEVYHIYEVHLVSEHIWCDDYLVRSFYLKNLRTSETRTVTQFHFLSWPQGGVPTQAKALLDFRRKVNKSYRGRSCPIVVHGSEGAGRTGAYILLDLVLGRMNKGAREIDIAATLEHLRDQRASLVATRQQFEFVLMAVAEEVHAILKALPANTSGEKRELEVKEKEAGTPSAQKSEKTEKEKSAEELPNSAQKTKPKTIATSSGTAIAETRESSEQSTKEKEKEKENGINNDKDKEPDRNKDKEKNKEKDRDQEKQTPKPKNAKGAKNKK